jgi:hypothetical protein
VGATVAAVAAGDSEALEAERRHRLDLVEGQGTLWISRILPSTGLYLRDHDRSLTPSSCKVGLVDIMIPGGLPQGSIAVDLDDNLDATVWTNAGGVDTPTTPNNTRTRRL